MVSQVTGAENVEALKAQTLGDAPHGFLGRRGGVSTGLVAGLNVGIGSGNDPAAIAENRRLAAQAVLPGADLVTVYQVHSADCVQVNSAIPLDQRPQVDAMATRVPGLLLGILTADCAPVLFHDAQARVIGAAHAGWKGALGGVTDATIAAMEALGATRRTIRAAIGPCISQASYEVDDGFVARFCEAEGENERFFVAGKPGHAHFDLEGYVAARLAAAGVGTVACLGEDTRSQEERFFSYRRSTLAGEASYGRQISLIGLKREG